jgi:hypothetical protein
MHYQIINNLPEQKILTNIAYMLSMPIFYAQDRDRWRTLVNAAMNLQVP